MNSNHGRCVVLALIHIHWATDIIITNWQRLHGLSQFQVEVKKDQVYEAITVGV